MSRLQVLLLSALFLVSAALLWRTVGATSVSALWALMESAWRSAPAAARSVPGWVGWVVFGVLMSLKGVLRPARRGRCGSARRRCAPSPFATPQAPG